MLRTESDTAARLRRNQTEQTKNMSQLETVNSELQERTRFLENTKLQLEKDIIQHQSALDTERRDRSHGSELISDLQGNRNL